MRPEPVRHLLMGGIAVRRMAMLRRHMAGLLVSIAGATTMAKAMSAHLRCFLTTI
jgi:hypothetical protein